MDIAATLSSNDSYIHLDPLVLLTAPRIRIAVANRCAVTAYEGDLSLQRRPSRNLPHGALEHLWCPWILYSHRP